MDSIFVKLPEPSSEDNWRGTMFVAVSAVIRMVKMA